MQGLELHTTEMILFERLLQMRAYCHRVSHWRSPNRRARLVVEQIAFTGVISHASSDGM